MRRTRLQLTALALRTGVSSSPPSPTEIHDTLVQDEHESAQAADLSRWVETPPGGVPGYTLLRSLGGGAFGTVWLASEDNTGKQVAIKFYTHQRGLDWSLLNREVEKLAVLYTSRHIVRLIDVGWNSEPPYYVMEYLASGSLASHLAAGPLPVNEAVRIAEGVLERPGSRARQRHPALRSEAGQRALGQRIRAPVVRLWPVASVERAKSGLGQPVLHGARAGRFAGHSRRPLGRLRAGRSALPHAVRQASVLDARDRRGHPFGSDARREAGGLPRADSPQPKADRTAKRPGGRSTPG